MERAAAERQDAPGRREQPIEDGVFVFRIAPSLIVWPTGVERGAVGFGLVAVRTIHFLPGFAGPVLQALLGGGR